MRVSQKEEYIIQKDNGKENGNPRSLYKGLLWVYTDYIAMLKFPQIRGTLLEVPVYNKDYSILGSLLGSACLWKLHDQVALQGLGV